jgi:hypothetical protein
MAAPHGTVRLDKVIEDGDLGFALRGISSQRFLPISQSSIYKEAKATAPLGLGLSRSIA